MQTIAWIFLVITSISMIARKEGVVFGCLFFTSAIIGFFAFGFLRGSGYLLLLFMGSLIFYLIERFLSMHTAIKLAKEDMEKK
jgi:hypothetical protein